ncbi:class I tRNA ligase family protein, partial [Candidatus Roizmanbacteria bacterium]|nr:class I tRNA ligase family protein [Candidatus Roizmanbacteria bacterium]
KGKGKGTAEDSEKKHFADFSLWFFKTGAHQNAQQTWRSPWGEGFPGWHIECSVMTKELFGPTIDIHMGGVEHISIHHTNEIAQSESANGIKFVNYWLHNEHVTINGGKMAKSQGTGLSIKELIEKSYDPLALRYFFLTAHYRTRQNFSYEALSDAQSALKKLRQLVFALKNQSSRSTLSSDKLDLLDQYRIKFHEAISNDIQIPKALAITWEMLKSNIPSSDKLDLLFQFDQVLGLRLNEVTEQKIPYEILKLAEEREIARKAKDFNKSDELRKKIEELGYYIEDAQSGYKIK